MLLGMTFCKGSKSGDMRFGNCVTIRLEIIEVCAFPRISLKVQQEFLCFGNCREEFFVSLELGGVYAAPAASYLNRMLQVEHLVINNIFQHRLWHAGMVENAADDNRVVRRIVMSQAVTRMARTPTHLRAGQQSVEKPDIYVVEDFFQVVSVTLRRLHTLPAPDLPDQMRLFNHM